MLTHTHTLPHANTALELSSSFVHKTLQWPSSFLSYNWQRRRKRKPGILKFGYFSAGYLHLPLRSVYSKTVLYSGLRSLLSPVFCVFWNFDLIPMYRETEYSMQSLLRECYCALWYTGSLKMYQYVSLSLPRDSAVDEPRILLAFMWYNFAAM